MVERVVPMIHVTDVRATVDWYQEIGFKVVNTYGNDGDGLSFAILEFGNSRVMFNQGGEGSTRHRREVDLYVYTGKVDDLFERLKERVEVVEPPHDTFYGMRELIIRDPNRFWITFGQPSPFSTLMTGVQEGNIDQVRAALESRNLKPETMTAAWAVAAEHNQTGIISLLEEAGAVPPAKVDGQRLHSYEGKYQSEQGFEINVTFEAGRLYAAAGAQEPLTLFAIDECTFRPIYFDDYGILTFLVENSTTNGCVLKHGSEHIHLKRV